MISQIYSNLNLTIDKMHLILRRIAERGEQLNKLQEASETLLQSSQAFRPVPWYWRICSFCYRSWWFQKQNEEDDIIEGFKEL
jgi:hypothetical protein